MLNNDNYFSAENNLKYMGSSQFKSFLSCEAATLCEIKGGYQREVTDALLIGSYVDAWYSGELEQFKAATPELFTAKGELKAQYRHAEYIIERVQRDKLFSQYMSGDKQKIFTGEIASVPFKIKVDSYHPDKCIVDLKCIKDFQPVYNQEKGIKESFIDFWGYSYQGAIYQEIVRQNTGKKLPFFLAAVTKEKEPDLKIIWLPDDVLAEKLEVIEYLLPRFQQLKNGAITPQRCEKCAYCKRTKVLTEPINYYDLMEDVDVQ